MANKPSSARHYVVYVLELSEEIRSLDKFLRQNPDGKRDCLYVGSTGKTPDERLVDHRDGRKSGSKFIFGYVTRLRPELAPDSRFLTRRNAELKEAKHAESLRRRGYFVWQG